MAYWQWDSNFETGIDAIDQQHRRIVSYVDRLSGAADAGDVASLQTLFDECLDFTIEHFVYEERLMQEVGYPFCDLHKKAHDGFIARMRIIQIRLEKGEDVSNKLRQELRIWWTKHFLRDDQDYCLYILEVKQQSWVKKTLARLRQK